jgi:chemotaxis signal transduction protein
MPPQFLSFRRGDEEYGIDILRVQEIRSAEAPTRVAGSPPLVKGLVKLRGLNGPMVDLRMNGCHDGRRGNGADRHRLALICEGLPHRCNGRCRGMGRQDVCAAAPTATAAGAIVQTAIWPNDARHRLF